MKNDNLLYSNKNLIPMGYYKNRPVYYHITQKRLVFSDAREIPKYINFIVLPAILVALPIIRITSSWDLFNSTVLKYSMLLLFSMLAIIAAIMFNKNQYRNIILYDALFSEWDYREYLQQQRRNNLLLLLFGYSLVVFTIICCALYLVFSNVLFLMLYTLLLFVCYLLVTNQIYKRIHILKKLEHKLNNN